MKKLYSAALALLAAGATAQQRVGLPAHPEAKHSGNVPAVPGTLLGRAKSVDYYTEEFTTGMNGWTSVNVLGALNWTWTDVGPGPTSSTYPVPPLATNTGGWMIIDDDYLGQNGVPTDTWLVSPVIDLSAAPPFLKVEFEQYFQEFSADTTYVGVTVDGGLTWNQVAINDGVGRDGRPNPELIDVNISDWVALGPSSVQLGFRYSAIWDYGWQVDNIHITDLEANDLALLNAHYTGFDYANTGFADMEYSIYPQQQIRAMQIKADVKNKGYADQTAVTFNVDISGPGGFTYSGTENLGSLTPSQLVAATHDGFAPSGTIGTYTVSVNTDQNETDLDPSDNDVEMTFEVSPDVFAHDNGVVQQYQRQGPDNATDQFEVGNYYELLEQQDLLSIRVALHDSTEVGTLIYGVIYDDQDPPGQIELTDNYEVTANDLNGIGGTNFVEIAFNNPVTVDAGQVVLIMAGSYGGTEKVAFATSGTSAAQVSIIHYPNSQLALYLTKTPMVRAVFENTTGIADQVNGSSDVTLQPNPMSANCVLSFGLEARANVRFELRDMTGRLVLAEDLGKREAGAQQHSIDGTLLAAGTYTWSLLMDGQLRTGLLVRE